MRNIHKITNIILIFTLTGITLSLDLSYAADMPFLRVPFGSYARLEKATLTLDSSLSSDEIETALLKAFYDKPPKKMKNGEVGSLI